MCGIYGFVSSSKTRAPTAWDAFFGLLRDLLRFAPRSAEWIRELSDTERKLWLEKIDEAQSLAYTWMEKGPFLEALCNSGLRTRLETAAGNMERWSGELERFSSGASLAKQKDWEFLNRLTVGGKDIAWQLGQDLLTNLDRLGSLLGEEEASNLSPETLGHAWQLHLVLSGLNRLEVRGRDSAGVAVYLRFPDADALDRFLDATDGATPRRQEFESRSADATLGHSALVRPARQKATLVAVFKIAREVGKMGENVEFLRNAIVQDKLFQAALREPGVEIQCLSHTRWASNGVISVANCHPVDSAVKSVEKEGLVLGSGEFIAVLNGDIDNYLELVERYVHAQGLVIDEDITTDAKIIPIVVAHHHERTGDLATALWWALREFEGSMAIGVMSIDHPEEFAFAQKGSGQGLFLGLTDNAIAVASEMYGLVEFTPKYVKAEGETISEGEVFRLRSSPQGTRISVVGDLGDVPLAEDRIRMAEITTRDINRGDKPHFFLKEIGESVDSVRKTLRGKFEKQSGVVRPALGRDVLPQDIVEALREDQIRRLFVIGQGTAAVAAEGVALLIDVALNAADRALQVQAFKATELSAHHLAKDMSDCLLVAVSQSGTTTDTNRTVDLARQRGARVLGIVNRRNSDLVYKSHGVLYTSDGRDIEMSVASTKAFYSQIVAGQILAISLAAELGAIEQDELAREVALLEALPEAMQRVLALEDQVAALARKFSLRRRHWAIAGSGAAKIAANEIRIKLSELCYKSIAVDFLEDKKHIDLSSEPLILVCASGIPADTVSDAVKEVAIFKAHDSVPLVIADEDEDRFEPYAAGMIKIPKTGGPLDFLLSTMVGHLFGYHSAAWFDRFAERLRAARGAVLEASRPGNEADFVSRLENNVVSDVVALEEVLDSGELDSGLNAGTASRLARVFELLLGRLTLDAYSRHGTSPLESVLGAISEAVNELSRPIDAIKHQAKTVTVGISRSEATPRSEGVLWQTFHRFQLPEGALAETHRLFLGVFERIVAAVEGATLYEVVGLDPLGRPTEEASIQVVRKEGSAGSILSRCEEVRPLTGTKWGSVKRREIFLGYGQTDSRAICIVPVIGEQSRGNLLLYHLRLAEHCPRAARLRALEALPGRLEEVRAKVTEGNLGWSPAYLDDIDVEALFLSTTTQLAGTILERFAPSRTL